MTFPTIHLNGTSQFALQQQAETAHNAVNVAINALDEMCPNARDYYPQGPHAFFDACDEHRARIRQLVAVRDEIYEMYEKIYDARK